MRIKELGQTVEDKGEVSLIVTDLPADCMVLFVSMDTWAEIKDSVEKEKG